MSGKSRRILHARPVRRDCLCRNYTPQQRRAGGAPRFLQRDRLGVFYRSCLFKLSACRKGLPKPYRRRERSDHHRYQGYPGSCHWCCSVSASWMAKPHPTFRAVLVAPVAAGIQTTGRAGHAGRSVSGVAVRLGIRSDGVDGLAHVLGPWRSGSTVAAGRLAHATRDGLSADVISCCVEVRPPDHHTLPTPPWLPRLPVVYKVHVR